MAKRGRPKKILKRIGYPKKAPNRVPESDWNPLGFKKKKVPGFPLYAMLENRNVCNINTGAIMSQYIKRNGIYVRMLKPDGVFSVVEVLALHDRLFGSHRGKSFRQHRYRELKKWEIEEIVEMRNGGASDDEIKRRFAIHTPRINQIVQDHGRQYADPNEEIIELLTKNNYAKKSEEGDRPGHCE